MDEEMLTTLREIRDYQKGTWFWMRFFGIVAIIGIVVEVIHVVLTSVP